MKFTDSKHCASRRHCPACRSSRTFRLSLAEAFELPEGGVDFACPHGQGEAAAEETPAPLVPPPVRCGCAKRNARRGLGDMVAAATTAIGIKRCGGCERRQVRLNHFGCVINRWLHRIVNWLVPCSASASTSPRSEN